MVAPPALVRATVAQVITAYGIDVQRRLAAGAMAPTTADTYARDLADFALCVPRTSSASRCGYVLVDGTTTPITSADPDRVEVVDRRG